jgi:hypothetical protein
MDRKLGGPQSRSGRGGEEKNSQSLPALEPPIIQPVAQRYTTELSHVRKHVLAIFKHYYSHHSRTNMWKDSYAFSIW